MELYCNRWLTVEALEVWKNWINVQLLWLLFCFVLAVMQNSESSFHFNFLADGQRLYMSFFIIHLLSNTPIYSRNTVHCMEWVFIEYKGWLNGQQHRGPSGDCPRSLPVQSPHIWLQMQGWNIPLLGVLCWKRRVCISCHCWCISYRWKWETKVYLQQLQLKLHLDRRGTLPLLIKGTGSWKMKLLNEKLVILILFFFLKQF